MKQCIYIFISVLFLLISCDRQSDPAPGVLSFDGKNFELTKGIIENYSIVESAYNFDVSLFSSGINLIETDGEIEEAQGKGVFIYFEMFSSSSTNLADGIYVFNPTYEAKTFDDCVFSVNYDFNNFAESDQYEIVEGTVSVVKSNTDYQIAFAGKTESGKSVSLNWEGPLTYYQYPYDTKSGANNPIKNLSRK